MNPPALPEPFQLEAALRGTQGDRPLLTHLAGLLLRDLPSSLAGLRHSLEMRDSTAMVRQAHHLAGGLAIMAAFPAMKLARNLESAAQAGDWETMAHLVPDLEKEAERLRIALEQL
jgi:HPt (histidine-containing phosphotransfer) domain-containing protein